MPGDMLASLSRLINCLGYKKLLIVVYSIFIASWIYLRLGVYYYYVYHVLKDMNHPDPSLKDLNFYEGCFLGILYLMHWIWLYFLLKMLFKFIKTGEAKDTLNNPDAIQRANKIK